MAKENRCLTIHLKEKKVKQAIITLCSLANAFRSFAIHFQTAYSTCRKIKTDLDSLNRLQQEKHLELNEDKLKEIITKEKKLLLALGDVEQKRQTLNLFTQFLAQQKQVKLNKLLEKEKLDEKKQKVIDIAYSLVPKYVKFETLTELLDSYYQDDSDYQKIKTQLQAQTRQQILKKVCEEYKGYIGALDRYFNAIQQKQTARLPIPPSCRQDGYYPYLLTNQQVKLQGRNLTFPNMVEDSLGKDNLRHFQLGEKQAQEFATKRWVLKQVEFNYQPEKGLAKCVIVYDKDVLPIAHQFQTDPAKTWAIDLGVNQFVTIANIPQFIDNIRLLNQGNHTNLAESFLQFSSQDLLKDIKRIFHRLDELKRINLNQTKYRLLHKGLPYELKDSHITLRSLSCYERQQLSEKLGKFVKQQHPELNHVQIMKKVEKLFYVLFDHHEHQGLSGNITQLANHLDINITKKKKVYLSQHNYQPKELHDLAIKEQNITQKMKRLELKLHHLFDNVLHNLSSYVVKEAQQQNIKHIIIGYNKGWKNHSLKGINKQFRRLFKRIPFARFIYLLTYKAKEMGILVETVQESYTSKIDHFADEPMAHQQNYLGKRKGSVFTSSLTLSVEQLSYDADVNGAIGIFRKLLEKHNLTLSTILNLAQDVKQRACQLNLLLELLQQIKLNRGVTTLVGHRFPIPVSSCSFMT